MPRLEAEMLDWLSGPTSLALMARSAPCSSSTRPTRTAPTGCSNRHPRSPTRSIWGRLIAAYGDVKLARMTGLDVKRWHKTWVGAKNRIASAYMAAAVLKSGLRFGMMLQSPLRPPQIGSQGTAPIARS